ncbi:transcription termination factor MTEF18, mitochondrial-like [Neltuma alba]|uniref:transcription termination factor MTEF18, mitochondrial-like n=1 Tax=Neltuma alba TaxID=207710 RepID=UPI0010A47162|nr:transcription termination factor MTEF18, mitochondrial-like [Prosopis alba]XP_028757837.1 transcription termination factor MTEF18, mitochondrial-like [Prosopis alba]XP_028757838.1 transcription termination factor MTEF18, mitochondrial-like [Prosopis alba]
MFSNLFSVFIARRLSTSSKLPNISKINSRYKKSAILQAQNALTEYLHGTSCLPYVYAEHISKNSPLSLASLIAKVDFSAFAFSKNFKKFLRYHPINEFDFFFESIGIDYNDISGLLPSNKFFFSEDRTLLDAAGALSEFGFPWNELGKLYMENSSIFRSSAGELKSKLSEFKKYGFCNVHLVGICLAFPYTLSGGCEVCAESEALLNFLKLVFLDFELALSVEGNMNSWHEVCRKIRVFYDLSGDKERLVELVGRNKNIFLEHDEEVLIQKVEYFCRFGVNNEEVVALLLQSPELLSLNLDKPVINIMKLLEYSGLETENLKDVNQKYDHVLGTNKIANLPQVMRALDLHEWFFNKIKDGNHQLLMKYIASYPDEDRAEEYRSGLEMIHVSRTPNHTMSKLNLLHNWGFGENASIFDLLAHLHGTSIELKERFDCLLSLGIGYSKLCKMVRMTPKILNQNVQTLEQKVNFLCQGVGCSLEYLHTYPGYLLFGLENRIKPRYRFHTWLAEKGLCTKDYSIASLVATSEKAFLARVYKMHPAAPKHWFEQFRV